MPRAILVVQGRSSDPAREQEFNEWYDKVHLPEVCALPGVVSARRFRLSQSQMNGAPPDPNVRPYLAIYEISADDVGGVLQGITEARVGGVLHMSDAMEQDPPPLTLCYEVLED